MNSNLLKSKIVAHGYTMHNFVDKINEKEHLMTAGTFYKKMNGTSEFTRNEIYCIQNVLNLNADDIESIFFASIVS